MGLETGLQFVSFEIGFRDCGALHRSRGLSWGLEVEVLPWKALILTMVIVISASHENVYVEEGGL
jgi:hypothetical protein